MLTKHVLGYLTIAFLAVTLSACETFSSAVGLEKSEYEKLTPEAKVFFFSAQHKYARVLAVTYKKQPPCGTEFLLACSDAAVVKALQDADLETEAAISAARVDPSEVKLQLMLRAYQKLARLLERELAKALLAPS